jgi:flagella basal body P-ring formation protein FlgA
VIGADQLRLQSAEVFPFGEEMARSIEQAAGRMLGRAVAAGAPIPLRMLKAAPEVRRGDQVRVQATSGGAMVEITAEAQSAGSTGDTVTVQNPTTGRRFRARVEGKGTVSVGDTAGDETWKPGQN